MVEVRKGNPIHRLTIAAIAASLRNMGQIMNKAESHAAKNNIDLNAYLQAPSIPTCTICSSSSSTSAISLSI
jgi:hypothetical protein